MGPSLNKRTNSTGSGPNYLGPIEGEILSYTFNNFLTFLLNKIGNDAKVNGMMSGLTKHSKKKHRHW